MADTRALLQKAVSSGLTAAESSFLKFELGRLAARVAHVNTAVGTQAVEMSPYARFLSQAGVSAAVSV